MKQCNFTLTKPDKNIDVIVTYKNQTINNASVKVLKNNQLYESKFKNGKYTISFPACLPLKNFDTYLLKVEAPNFETHSDKIDMKFFNNTLKRITLRPLEGDNKVKIDITPI